MLTIKIVKTLISSFLIVLFISTSAFSITDEDEKEIISVVSQQLQAFQNDDFEKLILSHRQLLRKYFQVQKHLVKWL